MSEQNNKPADVPIHPPATGYTQPQHFPKIVVMHSGEDEIKNKVRDLYIDLYVKLHEIYKSDQIFALAYQAIIDYENYWIELKTRVNVNFEEDIKKFGGQEAIDALKNLDKEKNSSRRKR